MTKNEILSKLKELKPVLNKDYSVKEIGLFGSYLENKATEKSDIDLLVELEKPIGWKFFTLEIYLEKAFGKKIDLVTKNALRKRLKEDILSKVNYA
ncbi:MAG: nucleotidyltransferase family protein [Chitinophagales bacterium]